MKAAPRYLLVLNAFDAWNAPMRRAASIDDLIPLVDTPGLRIFGNTSLPFRRFSEGDAYLLGHAFSPDGAPLPAEGSDALASSVIASDGARLLTSIWGGYVAVIGGSESFSILRDPSGILPCLVMQEAGLTFVASDLALLNAVRFKPLQVDWEGVTTQLMASGLKSPSTSLHGITELLPGSRLRVAGLTLSTETLWKPWDYVDNHNTQPLGEIAANLMKVTDTTVGAWGRCFDHAILSLSGGLDSSIVGAALEASRVKTTALNMATTEGEGDERSYARQVASHLGFDLMERDYASESIDPLTPTSAHLARPTFYCVTQSQFNAMGSVARQKGGDVYFNGLAGDNVFCNTYTATPLLDRYRTQGIHAGLWGTLNDICDLTGCALFEAIGAAIGRSRRPSRYIWKTDDQFIHPDLLAKAPPPHHEWLEIPADGLPGKAAHIAMLVRAQMSAEGLCRQTHPAQINVLLSQPLMEACLRIPSWVWISDGRNRAPIRHAYRDRLPQTIIKRQSKGGPSAYMHAVAERLRPILRRELLEGNLSAHNLLDREALLMVLKGEAPLPPGAILRLLSLLEAEFWTRQYPG